MTLIPQRLLCLAGILLLGGCADTAQIVKHAPLPSGATIAVIGFRDCVMRSQLECAGSGMAAANAVAHAFLAGDRFRVIVVPRPGSASQALTDDDAVELAKAKGSAYVIHGIVNNFLSITPPSAMMDGADISMRLLRVQDGALIGRFSDGRQARNNLTTPAEMIEEMAEKFRNAL